ncbi:MAG: DUF2799 domain-containing protein [Pseudomonadota bacterium]
MRSALLVTLLVLSGCGTVTELYCSGLGDYDVGARLARDGRDFGAVQSEIAACQGTAAPIAADRARAGWEAGRATYCTPSNAARLGQSGHTITGICTAQERAAMAQPFRTGLLVREIDRDLHSARARLDDLRAELRATPTDDAQKRRRIRGEIDTAERRLARLEDRRFFLLALAG